MNLLGAPQIRTSLMDGTRISTTIRVGRLLLASVAAASMHMTYAWDAAANDRTGHISALPALELSFEPLYPQRRSAEVAAEESAAHSTHNAGSHAHTPAPPRMSMPANASTQRAAAPATMIPPSPAMPEGTGLKPIVTGSIDMGTPTPDSKQKDIIEHKVHAAAPIPAQQEHLRLGRDVKEVLATLPSHIDTPRASSNATPVKLERVSPDILAVVAPEEQYKDYEKAGISISMRTGVFDASRQLAKAYDALVAGDDLTAIAIYRDIVAQAPKNEEALFGLAAIYHRAGSNDLAKPIYERLLEVSPHHREGLNNYLSLIAEYAPDDALVELEAIGARNPHFSPVHAQTGMLYHRLGVAEKAREKLLYAIQLAPHNLVYQYNLAIMLDQQGAIADAIVLYRKLVQAHARGASIPVDIATIQNRLGFLVRSHPHAAS
jgi:Tfp pilus assembly protein PilF